MDKNKRCFLAIALVVLFASSAVADLVGSSPPPTFTPEEQMTINRNPSLREASKSNPWVVRRILDALENTASSGIDNKSPAASSDGNETDQDIDRMRRASPEAVHDLFQLLKQAGKKQTK